MISGLNLVNLVAETCIYDYFSAKENSPATGKLRAVQIGSHVC